MLVAGRLAEFPRGSTGEDVDGPMSRRRSRGRGSGECGPMKAVAMMGADGQQRTAAEVVVAAQRAATSAQRGVGGESWFNR